MAGIDGHPRRESHTPQCEFVRPRLETRDRRRGREQLRDDGGSAFHGLAQLVGSQQHKMQKDCRLTVTRVQRCVHSAGDEHGIPSTQELTIRAARHFQRSAQHENKADGSVVRGRLSCRHTDPQHFEVARRVHDARQSGARQHSPQDASPGSALRGCGLRPRRRGEKVPAKDGGGDGIRDQANYHGLHPLALRYVSHACR